MLKFIKSFFSALLFIAGMITGLTILALACMAFYIHLGPVYALIFGVGMLALALATAETVDG